MLVVLMTFLFYACTRNAEEIMIVPPPTHPLSRSVLGYGVIKVSFTQVLDAPDQSGVSLGYLRRGSVVQVVERRSVNNQGHLEFWVLVDGNFRGWLREEEQVVDVYDFEAQAGTAAVALTR